MQRLGDMCGKFPTWMFRHQITFSMSKQTMCVESTSETSACSAKTWTGARTSNGKYERKFDFGYESVKVGEVFCFSQKDGGQHALVVTEWMSCGGSCMSLGVVQLFVVLASRPVITQQFVFDSHAAGTDPRLDKKSLTLTITGRSDDGSPNCCAKSFDVVTYQWQGDKFVQQSYKRVPAPPRGRRPIADPEVPSSR